MKKLNLLFVCLLSYAINAQFDYREGFIVTNELDTINGYIDFVEANSKFKKCSFKMTKESKPSAYSPDDIKAYGFFNDKRFVSKPIKTDGEVQNEFLEYLVKGKASLYSSKEHYYVQIGSDSLYLLENEKVDVKIGNKRFSKNSNRHIAVLNYLFRDCDKIKDNIEIFSLNEKNITRLVEKYNDCFEVETVSFKKKKKWTELKASVVSGLSMSSMGYSINSGVSGIRFSSEVVDSKFPISYSASVGANFDVYFPRVNERIFFNLGSYFQKSNFEHSTSQDFTYWSSINNTSVQAYTTTEFSQIKVPFGLGYSFSGKKILPVIRFGGMVNFVLNSTSYTNISAQRNNSSSSGEVLDPFTMRKTQVGMWAGLGLERNISKNLIGILDLRYEYVPNSGFEDYSTTTGSFSNMLIAIGIRI